MPMINVFYVFKECVLCHNYNYSFPQKQFVVQPSISSSIYLMIRNCLCLQATK